MNLPARARASSASRGRHGRHRDEGELVRLPARGGARGRLPLARQGLAPVDA